VLAIDGKNEWISIKDLEFNEEKNTIGLKEKFKFYSLKTETINTLKTKDKTQYSLVDDKGNSTVTAPQRLIMNLGITLRNNSKLKLGDREYVLENVEQGKDGFILFKDRKSGKISKRDKWSCWFSYHNFVLEPSSMKTK